MGITLFIAIVVLLTLGFPVAFALAISAALAVFVGGRYPQLIVFKEMFTGIDSFPLMAVPFFILAAELMSGGALTHVLLRFAAQFVGHLRGGLGYANVLSLTLFSGKRQTCHKPVFGLVNCCAGKASGLITTAAGAAAIAGGPVAIAALATPFLTMFMCSNDEKLLDVQDRMGMCHKLGEYCSDKVLGICTSKKTAYCCFESKLSRILQEQGRPQINKP